jgi:hypothetical protein
VEEDAQDPFNSVGNRLGTFKVMNIVFALTLA